MATRATKNTIMHGEQKAPEKSCEECRQYNEQTNFRGLSTVFSCVCNFREVHMQSLNTLVIKTRVTWYTQKT